jgi:hypothetical protein
MKPDDGGTGSGGGGAVDRGDNFLPTGADAVDDPGTVDQAAADTAAAALEAELAAKAKPADKPAAEAEVDKDEDADKDETKPKGKARIPLDRHEAILAKERGTREALERRLAQYEQGDKVAERNAEVTVAETKLLTMEADYAKLITDGEVEKATKVMADIRRLERDLAASNNDLKIQAAVAAATESARYNIALERIEAAFPALNQDHADFDAEKMTDVADLKVTYERKGMTPTAALQKAVEKLMPTVTAKQEAAVEVKPKVDAAAIAAERKKDAVAKTLAAVTATPASTASVGLDSDKAGGSIGAKDVMKMSYKDFSALPEEALARMRGDVL